ncbi:hypothetical protein ABT282_36970 [Streptomyces sp. NPDC000927]|uniref:hypothetical protein n=1 Tax=Streptomyces sp. NPDC000927 TaxID=3154371 RepID=UPI00331D80B2
MPSSLALALDAVPLGDDLRRPVDYDARLVAEACVGTLCQEAPGEPDPQPHAALGLRPLNGGLRWRLAPDPQARWSNGLPLLPTHVVAGIRDAAAKDRQLGRFLRPGCDAVLGPYAPAGTDPSGGPRLVRHEHTGPEGLPDELRFPVFKDLAGAVSAYRVGTIDAPPTTSFAIPDAVLLADAPDLMARPVALFASLEFGRRCRRLRDAPGCARPSPAHSTRLRSRPLPTGCWSPHPRPPLHWPAFRWPTPYLPCRPTPTTCARCVPRCPDSRTRRWHTPTSSPARPWSSRSAPSCTRSSGWTSGHGPSHTSSTSSPRCAAKPSRGR